eukprot:11115366-Alexandrium_andersonii.AAC.1
MSSWWRRRVDAVHPARNDNASRVIRHRRAQLFAKARRLLVGNGVSAHAVLSAPRGDPVTAHLRVFSSAPYLRPRSP